MTRRSLFRLALLTSLLISAAWNPSLRGQETVKFKLDVASLLDLKTIASLTPESLELMFKDEHYQQSPTLRWKNEATKSEAFLCHEPYSNIYVDLRLGDSPTEDLDIQEMHVFFAAGKCVKVTCLANGKEAGPVLLAIASKGLGAPVGNTEKLVSGWLSAKTTEVRDWSNTAGRARLETQPTQRACLAFGVAGQEFKDPLLDYQTFLRETRSQRSTTAPTQGPRPPGIPPGAVLLPTKRNYQFFVRLGLIMQPEVLWRLTPAALESKLPTPDGMTSNPLFEWSSSDRSGMRLTRKPASNVEQELLFFDDNVQAEEVLIEFKQGVARALTVSFLNEGDSGSISQEKFNAAFGAAGRGLGQLLGVKPTTYRSQGVGNVEGFSWKNAHTTALLEHNPEATKGQPKFLRLRMAPNISSEALTSTHVTEGRSAPLLRDSVTGDVMITTVPMVDQGQKGYCVAATCQRVLNYLGVVCDQHQLADLLQTSAKQGTSVEVMYDALTKVNLKYGSKFKAVAARVAFMKMTSKEFDKYERAPLMPTIRQYIDRRAPLLWSVDLGKAPDEKGQGRMSGGHMRLIIGYNDKTSSIIYTDSWGAGHEKKQMSLSDTEDCTHALFVMD